MTPDTVDKMFWGLISTVAVAMLTMLLTRVAAIAAARRAGYATILAELVSLWRLGTPQKHAIFVQLSKLVVDGNRDLDDAIETLVTAINLADPAAEQALLHLLDQMRATAFMANVRESFLGSGRSRKDLFAKLLLK